MSLGQRLFSNFVAILLLPACAGSFRALCRVIADSGRADTVWVALLSGVACWCVVYVSLPKPWRVYVVGHETTHVLWVWLFGGSVRGFTAGPNGGHVVVTKSNFLVMLAPYFFPIYALLVVATFLLLGIFCNVGAGVVWFHLMLGAAYAFHVTLTWDALRQHQSDVSKNGYLFSGVVIWLGNVAVLLLCIPSLTRRVGILTALSWCLSETVEVLRMISKSF